MIAAGRLNKQVTIESVAGARDSHGQKAETWSTFAGPLWAAIEPLRGKEIFAARQFVAEATHKITIRYRTGVTAKMRVKYGSRYFRIEGPPISPNETHEALEMMCAEVPTT